LHRPAPCDRLLASGDGLSPLSLFPGGKRLGQPLKRGQPSLNLPGRMEMTQEGTAAKPYTCEYCGEGFDTSVKKAQHIRADHREETEAKKRADELAARLGGLPPEELSEKTREFAEALDAAAPGMQPKKIRQMLKAYDEQVKDLSTDPKALEDFLDDYGLTRRQQRQILRQMMGGRRETAGVATSGPGMGFHTVQTPWGPMAMLVVNRGEGDRVAPIPWTQPTPTESPEQARREARFEARMDRMEERLKGLLETGGKRAAGPQEPPMRRGQRPIFDSDGNLILDKEGNPVYEQYEEPWEAGGRDPLTELLLRRELARKEPREIDEEALALKLREKIKPEGTSDSQVVSKLDALSKTVEGMKAASEIERAVEAATRPLRQQLETQSALLGERTTYKGLSDSQAQLRFQKELVDTVVATVGDVIQGFREDMRPVILRQAVEGLRKEGVGEEMINRFLGAVREKVPTGAIPEKAKEEALKRVQQWARQS